MALESDLALLRLLQLASPALPVGMYSYSQGLEKAVEEHWVNTEESLEEWLGGLLERCLGRVDAPLLARLYEAWAAGDEARLLYWSAYLRACRETQEARLEDQQTGQALARVLAGLEVPGAEAWMKRPTASLATLFALAGTHWQIPKRELIMGYCWSWLENQVLCALKLAAFGQGAGQRVLTRVSLAIPAVADQALRLQDTDLGGASPAFAICGARHETQYSRLFRS
jgi:urease accessory protein